MRTALTLAFLFCACCGSLAHADDDTASAVDPAHVARIRIFGANGLGVVLDKNSNCEDNESIRASGGGGSWGAFIGKPKNETIGMPDSELTRHMERLDHAMSKAYYREYVLDPQQPATLEVGFPSSSFTLNNVLLYAHVCKKRIRTFHPQAGKNYEVVVTEENIAQCDMQIGELQADGTLQPISTTEGFACQE